MMASVGSAGGVPQCLIGADRAVPGTKFRGWGQLPSESAERPVGLLVLTSGTCCRKVRWVLEVPAGRDRLDVIDACRDVPVRARRDVATPVGIEWKVGRERCGDQPQDLVRDRPAGAIAACEAVSHEDGRDHLSRWGLRLRSRQEGVSAAAARRGITAIVKALGDDGPMTRAQLRGVLDKGGVPTARQAMVHILLRATLDGLIIRGPMIGREHAFALVVDWLGERPKIDRDRALAELARRYLAGHGPAEDRDLANWAQLPLRDARAGLKAIASELDYRPDGLVDLPRDEVVPLPPPRLLGPFDPLLLGWRSRGLVLDDAQEVVTTNGIIKAIALIGGRAAGTWTMPRGHVELRLWGQQSRATTDALRREASAVEAYLAAD